MRMGNLLYVERQATTMSAKRPAVGMKHLTVVPENFERPERADAETDEDDADERREADER